MSKPIIGPAASLVVLTAMIVASPAIAQQRFIGDQAQAKRVIQLQPQTSSATTQSPSKPNESTGPQIGFEPIRVPKVLQSPTIPSSSTNDPTQALAPPTPLGSGSKPVALVPQPISHALTPVRSRTLTSNLQSAINTRILSPKFVNVNKVATVNVELENRGQTDVGQVSFLATLPEHVKLTSTSPEPASINGREVRFDLAGMTAKQKLTIRLNLVPTTRSPIDIATTIVTNNQSRLLVAVREPKLEATISGPDQANIGDQISHELVITNVGDGTATDIDVETLYPTSLVQLKSSLVGRIASLESGKSTKIVYQSQALAAGPTILKSSIRSDAGDAPALADKNVVIYEPTLHVSAIGPKINYVNRNGIYTINLENQGKVDVTDVKVALTVPAGMKVTTISREAKVDAEKGILRWNFDRISIGAVEQIQLMAVAAEEGERISTILVDSRETAEKKIQLTTRVTTRANVSVAVKNESGPVQVGGKALFLVELVNNGSRQALDVNVNVELPDTLRAIENGSQKLELANNSISFVEPQIAPGRKVSFKFSAVGVTSGEHVVRTVTRVDGSERRVVAEDSVFVYDIDEARVSESLKPDVPRRQ